MQNITEYLIEEGSAEEDELVGANGDNKSQGTDLERDEELIAVLDRLILYLRIIHSVDYYNHAEYPNEDEMPNRCGIMHARGIPPTTKVKHFPINLEKTFHLNTVWSLNFDNSDSKRVDFEKPPIFRPGLSHFHGSRIIN